MRLKPCPFCGGDAVTEYWVFAGYFTVCSECGATSGFCETEKESIDSWNKRAEELEEDDGK